MELSTEKYAELYKRGFNYARVLAVDWENVEDVISRAFIKLLVTCSDKPESQHKGIIDNCFKLAIYQEAIRDYETRKRIQGAKQAYIHNGDYATAVEDIAKAFEYENTSTEILHGVYEHLSDDDILLVLALVDNDFNIALTAEYLGEQRTNVYHLLKKLRERIHKLFPDLFSGTKGTGHSQPYMAKWGHWNVFLKGVEVIALFDEKPQWDTVPFGTLPTSSPAVQEMTLAQYEGGF